MAAPSAVRLQDKFTAARAALNLALIEREEAIDLVLMALLAGEHLCLISAPGQAKSLLLDSLCDWCRDLKTFRLLMTRFSVPAEIFGPLDVRALKEGRYCRVTGGYMPDASIAFLDEVFRGSSACLNALLQAMAERSWRDDGQIKTLPLRMICAASNDYPSPENAKELNAPWDRFTIRAEVKPVRSAAGRKRLLRSADSDLKPFFTNTITAAELDTASAEAVAMPVSQEAWDGMDEINRQLNAEGIFPGDRRARKAVKIVKARAWLDGDAEVGLAHLEPLKSVLWVDPEQRLKTEEIVLKTASPTSFQVGQILTAIEEVLAQTNLAEVASAIASAKKLEAATKELKKLPVTDNRVKAALQHVQQRRKDLLSAAAGSGGED